MWIVDTTDDPADFGADMAPKAPQAPVATARAARQETGFPGYYAPKQGARKPPTRLIHWTQYTRFLLVGVSNAVVDLAVLNVLLWANPTRDPLTLVAYNTFAVALAILNSYLWNTRWTFRAEATHTPRERLLFIGQAMVNILVNNLVLLGVTGVLPTSQGITFLIWNNVAKLAAMIAASSISFLLLRAIVFHPRTF